MQQTRGSPSEETRNQTKQRSQSRDYLGRYWKKNIMIYFFMSSLLYLNRRDFMKIPKYIYVLFCCRFRPKLLIAIFLYDVSPPNDFLLLLGQTSPVKYYNNEKIRHKAYFLTSGKVSSITFPPHKDLYLHKLAFIFDPWETRNCSSTHSK